MTILVQQQLRELAQAAPHKDWRAGNYYSKPFLLDIEVLADTPDGLMVVLQGNQNFAAESVASVAFVGAASPAAILALLDEIDRLSALVIERETVRIGQGLQRHDDQKQIDDLVALGIQQDKDEIARLKAENAELRRGQHVTQAIATMAPDQIRDTYNWAYYEPREIGSDAEQIRAGMIAVLRKAMTKEQQP